MYTLYVGNFDKATETLSTWTKKSPPMAAVIEEIQVSFSFLSYIRLNFLTINKLLIIRTSFFISSVGRVLDYRAGGRGFHCHDKTNTQGLKITEK